MANSARARLESSKFWNPGVSLGGLKILPVWVRPPLGAPVCAWVDPCNAILRKVVLNSTYLPRPEGGGIS